MTGGCGRLLSTEDHTHARTHTHKTHTNTSDASSPLLVSLGSRLSLSLSFSLRKLQGFDHVFGCVVWAVQRFRTRLRGELATAYPEALVLLREGAAVLHGLSAPPGLPSGHRSIRVQVRREGGAQEL